MRYQITGCPCKWHIMKVVKFNSTLWVSHFSSRWLVIGLNSFKHVFFNCRWKKIHISINLFWQEKYYSCRTIQLVIAFLGKIYISKSQALNIASILLHSESSKTDSKHSDIHPTCTHVNILQIHFRHCKSIFLISKGNIPPSHSRGKSYFHRR